MHDVRLRIPSGVVVVHGLGVGAVGQQYRRRPPGLPRATASSRPPTARRCPPRRPAGPPPPIPPSPAAAQCRGVSLAPSVACTSAPRSRSVCTAPAASLNAAACNGVDPSAARAWTCAPWSSRPAAAAAAASPIATQCRDAWPAASSAPRDLPGDSATPPLSRRRPSAPPRAGESRCRPPARRRPPRG